MDKESISRQVFVYTGQNFSLWKVQMQIAFDNKELMEVADDTATLEEAEDNDAWKKENNSSKWLITPAVDTEHLDIIAHRKTSADMSERLLTLHEQVSSESILLLIQNFVDYKYQPGDSMAGHIAKVDRLAPAFENAGQNFSEE